MKKLLLTTLCSLNILSSCAVYKVEVQQGNVLEQKMLNQLEVGMPAQKVRFIMGTPLIEDLFRQRRWDYVYSLQPSGKKRQQRHIVLFFDDNNQLLRVEGDVKASQTPNRPPADHQELEQSPIL